MSSKNNKAGKGSSKATAVAGSTVTPAGAYVPRRVFPTPGDGVAVGVTSGLQIIHWYNGVFLNVAQGAKWTDADINTAVRAEYPGRAVYQSVTAYRAYYNGRKHGLGIDGAKNPLPKCYAYRAPAVATVVPATPVVTEKAPKARKPKASSTPALVAAEQASK